MHTILKAEIFPNRLTNRTEQRLGGTVLKPLGGRGTWFRVGRACRNRRGYLSIVPQRSMFIERKRYSPIRPPLQILGRRSLSDSLHNWC